MYANNNRPSAATTTVPATAALKPRPAKSIEEAAEVKKLEFRKPNGAIGLRVTEGRLSLLARKLFNSMVYAAQRAGQPGVNAPMQTALAQEYFWVPLGELVRHAAYDSNDTKALKTLLKELQKISLVIEEDRDWYSSQLVAEVTIHRTESRHGQYGQAWVGFAFPPKVRTLIESPANHYTPMSLFYQTQLRSGPGLGLYEIARQYRTCPSHKTHIEGWQWWYWALSGNPITEEPPEYKYFKRDILNPAIDEVSSMTDLAVELIEHKHGRKVAALQFEVRERTSGFIEPKPEPVVNTALVDRLVAVGFSPEQASELTALHSEDDLVAAAACVEVRKRSKNAKPLDSATGYFRWALKTKQRPEAPKSDTKALSAPRAPASPVGTVRERYRSQQGAKALRYFEELELGAQEPLITEFRATKSGKAAFMGGARTLESPLLRAAFSGWLAAKLWGDEPSDADLLAFVESQPDEPSH